MNILKYLVGLSLSATLVLAAQPSKKDAELNAVIKTGQKSSKILLQTLGKNMKKHMKKGGVFKALDFCANEAYTLTQDVNKKLPVGVSVKRISMKFRSPANAPKDNEVAILQSFKKMGDANVILPKYLVEKTGLHTYKYYKPLVINKKVCLKCHGVIKDIELKRAISSRYPLDTAMKYKMGDLRGAIVVTIDKRKKK